MRCIMQMVNRLRLQFVQLCGGLHMCHVEHLCCAFECVSSCTGQGCAPQTASAGAAARQPPPGHHWPSGCGAVAPDGAQLPHAVLHCAASPAHTPPHAELSRWQLACCTQLAAPMQ